MPSCILQRHFEGALRWNAGSVEQPVQENKRGRGSQMLHALDLSRSRRRRRHYWEDIEASLGNVDGSVQ